MRLFASAAATFFLVAPAALPQRDFLTNCDQQSCTATVDFGDRSFGVVAGAPYSGHMDRDPVVNTLRDGTHQTIPQSPGPMTYRDSKGRVRTDQPLLRRPPSLRGKLPDDSVIAVIEDPVAGYRYVLDPVNRVAHRMPLESFPAVTRNAMIAPEPGTQTTRTVPGGSVVSTTESLGTRNISGVEAVGQRTTHTGPAGPAMSNVDELWTDAGNGVTLVSKNMRPNGVSITTTMHDYSNAELDPALFRIPDGYQVVDETGPFRIVHATENPNAGSGGPQAGVTLISPGGCFEESCTLKFRPGGGLLPMFTGAPYSGRQSSVNVQARTGGAPVANAPDQGAATYRDSQGRIRTEQRAFRGPGANANPDFTIVKIQDPVTGYLYILDSVNRVAHRMPLGRGAMPLPPPRSADSLPQIGTPGGTITREDLGTQIISGVSAAGIKTTTNHPPGTSNGNDRTITQVSETWVDPRTEVMLLSKTSGPEGEFMTRVEDYSTAEPDPALFQIPKGYRVVDETGSFGIVIPRAN